MATDNAKDRCRAFVKAGMRRLQAEDALYREGFDEQEIKEAIAEYETLRTSHRTQQQRFTRCWAGSMFLACGGLFVYFVFLAHPDRHVFHFWLLAPAFFGLFKALLP